MAGGFRHSTYETEILFTDHFANREPVLISLAGGGVEMPDFRHPFQNSCDVALAHSST